MPRFRQFLLTLNIAIYPLFARRRCILCLQTITPTGSEELDGKAYQNIHANEECIGNWDTHEESKMWPEQ